MIGIGNRYLVEAYQMTLYRDHTKGHPDINRIRWSWRRLHTKTDFRGSQ